MFRVRSAVWECCAVNDQAVWAGYLSTCMLCWTQYLPMRCLPDVISLPPSPSPPSSPSHLLPQPSPPTLSPHPSPHSRYPADVKLILLRKTPPSRYSTPEDGTLKIQVRGRYRGRGKGGGRGVTAMYYHN